MVRVTYFALASETGEMANANCSHPHAIGSRQYSLKKISLIIFAVPADCVPT
jgi:hypothetical protein